jgi:glycosyltransferase involved in cell wall biosynthesis
METVSVVLMAYDEAASVEATARELHAALARLGDGHELLMVDDGSTDGTADILDTLAGELDGCRVIHHPRNTGLGGVYRTGFSEARGRLVTFFPADGQFPATILEQFASLMGDHDLLLGYLPGRRGPLRARALSHLERLLYSLLFMGFPRFQGVMMVRSTLLRTLPLTSNGRGWAVVMEMILRAQRSGARILSVPTAIRPRSRGSSKVGDLRTIWSNLRQAIELRRRF